MKPRVTTFLVGVTSALLGASGGASLPSESDSDYLAAAAPAAPAALAVEQYRAAHGRYPEALSEAGAALPVSPGPPFRYRAYREGADYDHVAGDYDRDGFEIGYTARGVYVNR